MWTYLANWLVQDGEIPELQAGAVLSDIALRASCRGIQESEEPDGVNEVQGRSPAGVSSVQYRLSGVVTGGGEPGCVVISVGAFQVLAQPNSFRESGGASAGMSGVERYSPNFVVPSVGTRVTATCQLEVMADYETDGFAFPDLRRDWVVRRLRVEHRALVAVAKREFRVEEIVRVDDISCMHRSSDEAANEHVTYLVDVETMP